MNRGEASAHAWRHGATPHAAPNLYEGLASVLGTVDSAGDVYGLAGQRLTMGLPGGGTWQYNYESSLRVLPKDDPNALAPRLKNILDDQGRRVEYFFDYRGRLLEARSNETFDGAGNLVAYLGTVYTFDSNGANPPLSRDLLARIRNTWNWKDGMGQWQSSVLVQNDYTYSATGNRLTNAISDWTGPIRTETYGYDELSRLTSVNYGDGQTQGYTFDAMGNRLTKTDNVTGNETYTVNAANMLLTRNGNAYTNDTNGNTLTGGGRTNTWDGQNRLTQCVLGSTTTSHTYGADGLRRRTVEGANTTDFILDGQSVVRTLLNGVVDKTFFHGARGPEYERTGANAPLWNLYDGLGSVTGTVDAAGNVVSARKYDVYGAVRGLSGPTGTKHKFVGSLGHQSEDETGLIYMRARYYDPVTGRFVSEDPEADGLNWFAYARGNPTNAADPGGRSAVWANWTLFALGAFFTAAAMATAFLGRYDRLTTTRTKVFNFSMASSLVGAFFFSLAMMGVDMPIYGQWSALILSNLSGGLGAAIAIMIKQGGELARQGSGFAALAVVACVTYGVLVGATIATIGVD